MKSIAKKMMSDKKHNGSRNDEKKVLVNSLTQNRPYGESFPKTRNISTSSYDNNNSTTNLDASPMISIRAGSIPSPPSKRKDVASVINVNFDKVPFQFYSSNAESWKSAYIQAVILVVVCIFVPSIFMLIAIYVNRIRLRYKPRMTDKERKKSYLSIVLLLLITLTKDLIIVMALLHVLFNSPSSNYEIGYSPVLFFWCLLLFAFPLTVYYFAEPRYIFGFDSSKKRLLETCLSFLSSKVKNNEVKKVDDQEKYFNERYKLLASIKCSNDEYQFLKSSTSRRLVIIASVLAVLTCTVHCLIPLLLQIADCTLCKNVVYQEVVHNQTVNVTLPITVYKTVMGMAAINSLLVSLFASIYFIYVLLWQLAMLAEWKRFNATESDTMTTLINGGPQGVAMWWKVRQTLHFFSSSTSCMSVLIVKLSSIVCLLLIACLSLALVFETNVLPYSKSDMVVVLLIDNIFLYIGLLLLGLFSLLVYKEEANSSRIIELKQLNVGYELGRLMNLEQETVESEPGVRLKVRVMRGSLMLLQELTSALQSAERSDSHMLIKICLVVATLTIIPSTIFAGKYLYLKK